MSTPLTDVQIASQLPPSQRLMLVQVQRADDIDPRNGATRHALWEKGLLKDTTGWESLKLTEQGQEVAAACALATLNSLSKEARGVLLDVANNRYDPQHRFRFHLSSASLAIVSDKAGTAILTSLGICTAALAMMEETPAPVVEAAPEPAAPVIEEQSTPPVEDAQPPAAPVKLTPDEEAMLMQTFYNRPIRPQNRQTRDRLVELGLLIVESEYMWTLSLTNAGRQAAEKLDILRGLTKFDLCKLWHLLQGKPVHERELSDSVRAFDLATFDESKDLNKRGMAALTEAGRAAAQRTPRYVADKLTKLYPTRGQALIDLIRGSDTRISEGLSKTLWDWGVIELARPDAKLTAFGHAVAVECAAILGQPIDVDTPSDESTPAAPVVEAPAPEPAQQLAEIASGVGYDLETAQEAARTIIEITYPEGDPAPVVEAAPAEAEPVAPIEEPRAAPVSIDDRAALLSENERLRAALVEANDALAVEWLKVQDKQMISKKIGAQHKQVQQILRSNSEAASRRALKVEAENIELKRQLADLKKAQTIAPTATASTDDTLRAELDAANKMVESLSREKFQTQNLLVYMLQRLNRSEDHLGHAQRYANKVEGDLKTIQQTAQQWRAEHAAAMKQVETLTAQLDRGSGSVSDGHIILKDATTADLNRLAVQHRPLILTQFVGEALYIVAGPPAAIQPQPEKPATDHIDGFDDMVAFEDADIINIDDAPAPDPVNEPVFVFDSSDTTDDPDGTQQMIKMMREGARPDSISRALDERNKAAARADFARRMPATPPTSRSGPPRPALTSGQ